MKTQLTLLFFISLFSYQLNAQLVVAPDWTMTDVNGVEHSLYDDYLNQDISVFILCGTTWNPFDSIILDSGVLQDFQDVYAPSGTVAIFFIEIDTNTPEAELYGTGENGYDYVSNVNFPIIDDAAGIMQNEYGVAAIPSTFMICPDGTLYSDMNGPLPNGESIFYTDIESADYLADAFTNTCGSTYENLNTILGQVYADENDNCDYEAGTDLPMPGVTAAITGPDGTIYRTSASNGIFTKNLLANEYTVEVLSPNEFWTTCEGPQSVNFMGEGETAALDFGLTAVSDCPAPVVDISTAFLRRCFDNTLYIEYCNEGTLPTENSTIQVELDNFMEFQSASIDLLDQTDNILTFDVGVLDVWECGEFTITVYITCDTAAVDAEQCFSATIAPDYDCVIDPRSSQVECVTIIGSWDPNDKRAFPAGIGEEHAVLPNQEMKYIIRFQNTGSDTAFTVVVADEISPLLDMSTFRAGLASHDYILEIEAERNLKFIFNNIMLPDSNINEPASHGFLTFYIDQVANLSNGTLLENEAAIYFDFNEPVITNIAYNTIDDGILATRPGPVNSLAFELLPNPASGQVLVDIGDQEATSGIYTLYDLNGKIIQSQAFSQTKFVTSLDGLSAGIYIIRLVSDDGYSGIKKLVVEAAH